MTYRVFISHGWDDRWIARQMAGSIERVGGLPFIDIFDIAAGDRIEARVFAGLHECRELVALITPGSVGRNWVWTEIAGAWTLGRRVVGVLHGITTEEIAAGHGGLACLAPTNIIALNDFDEYILQLTGRIARENRE